jgi:hypothetical protein
VTTDSERSLQSQRVHACSCKQLTGGSRPASSLLLVCNHIHTTTANCLHNAMPTSWLEYMHSPACVCASQAHEVAFCKWKLDAWVLVVFVHPSQLPKTPQQRKLSVRTRTMQGTDISLNATCQNTNDEFRLVTHLQHFPPLTGAQFE